MLMGATSVALAVGPAQLDTRIRELTGKFEVMQAREDTRIPPEVLSRARGIILLDRTKAGFLFAYEGGGGIAMVKNDAGVWSPVGFVGASDASLGFQVGGEKNFYAILLMNRDSTRLLTDPSFKFAGEATGVAGDVSAGVGASSLNQPVLVYSSSSGLYGGASVQGGSITPDQKANDVYYGHYVAMGDILFSRSVQSTESSTDLARKIDEYSNPRVEPAPVR